MWCGLVWWMLLLNDCGFKTGVATSVRHPLNTEEKKKNRKKRIQDRKLPKLLRTDKLS